MEKNQALPFQGKSVCFIFERLVWLLHGKYIAQGQEGKQGAQVLSVVNECV
jgi:hypothetical protein